MESVLPAPSVARTSKVCPPSVRPEYDFGLAHELQAPASIRQAKLDPDSEEMNEKLALASVIVPLGPAVICVSGDVVSDSGGAERRRS